MWPFVVTLWHFHVADRNFEENHPTLKTKMAIIKNYRKTFLVECDGWLFLYVKLVRVGLNVCECGEKAES